MTEDEQRQQIVSLLRELESCNDEDQRIRLLDEAITRRELNAYEIGRHRSASCPDCIESAERALAEQAQEERRTRLRVIG